MSPKGMTDSSEDLHEDLDRTGEGRFETYEKYRGQIYIGTELAWNMGIFPFAPHDKLLVYKEGGEYIIEKDLGDPHSD